MVAVDGAVGAAAVVGAAVVEDGLVGVVSRCSWASSFAGTERN